METTRRLSVGFFVLYFSVLILAGLWLQIGLVQREIGESLNLIYILLASALVYVALRAYLVLVRHVSAKWDAWWLAADLLIVTAAVRLTGGFGSEAALWYFWPIATASIQRRPTQTLVVGLSGAMLYVLAVAVLEKLQPGEAALLTARVFVFVVATALATWYARNEVLRVEEMADLREKEALSDYRLALSREMHDGIQQDLAGIAKVLEAACALMDDDLQRAASKACDQRFNVTRTRDELQYLIDRLRASVLDRCSIEDALEQYLVVFSRRSSVKARLEIDGTPAPLPPEAELAAFRTVQEALTNAEKHAEAGSIQVRLRFALGRFQCSVVDDGLGFDPSEERDNGGLGLLGMRERAENVDGTLEIASAPGQGTEITLTVPLHNLAPVEEEPDDSD